MKGKLLHTRDMNKPHCSKTDDHRPEPETSGDGPTVIWAAVMTAKVFVGILSYHRNIKEPEGIISVSVRVVQASISRCCNYLQLGLSFLLFRSDNLTKHAVSRFGVRAFKRYIWTLGGRLWLARVLSRCPLSRKYARRPPYEESLLVWVGVA